MKTTLVRMGIVGMAVTSFAIGYAFAQSAVERAIAQAQADLDANTAQLTKDVNSIAAELKQIVASTNIDLGQSEKLVKEIEAKTAVALTGLESSMVRAHAAVLEKTVHNNNIENEAGARLADFFKVDASVLGALRSKGVTIGSMVVGLGIAKASGQKAEDVFAQYEQKKAWATIAQSAKLKPGELIKALEGLVPKE